MIAQLRIDAVGYTENEVWLFEVKPRAGRSALGQLLGYANWYLHDFRPEKPLRLGVVCEMVDANMAPLFRRYGIRVFVV